MQRRDEILMFRQARIRAAVVDSDRDIGEHRRWYRSKQVDVAGFTARSGNAP
jgi:hypothetical protein